MSEHKQRDEARRLEVLQALCVIPAPLADSFFLAPHGEGVRMTFSESIDPQALPIPRAALYLEMDGFRRLAETCVELIKRMDEAKAKDAAHRQANEAMKATIADGPHLANTPNVTETGKPN